MSYTPGPWRVDRPYIRGAGRAIASLESWHNEVEDAANTHLIAAAPELFEALEAAYMVLGPQKSRFKDYVDAVTLARAALAKARGEEGEEDA